MLKKVSVCTVMLIFMLALPAFALLEIADEETMLKLEEVLVEHLDVEDITVEEAQVIDFPSVSDERFYKVLVFQENDSESKTFYLNIDSLEVVDESFITDLYEQEASADDPVVSITSTDTDDDDEEDYVQAPEGSEVGIVSVDEDENSTDLIFLYWGVPAGLFVVFLGFTVISKKKQ